MRLTYDDYNGVIRMDGLIGTVTTQMSNIAWRHAYKMIEVYELPIFDTDGLARAIMSNRVQCTLTTRLGETSGNGVYTTIMEVYEME